LVVACVDVRQIGQIGLLLILNSDKEIEGVRLRKYNFQAAFQDY
jgi:hypothetical protein